MRGIGLAMEKLKEACGVVGIFDTAGEDVTHDIYLGLLALQHRGQESAGIAVTKTYGSLPVYEYQKGLGLVNEVFSRETLNALSGNLGVGHVRYSTTGESSANNAQPLVLNYLKGTLALAHNGNLVNAKELRQELSVDGAIFQTTTDTETIAYHIARKRAKCGSIEQAVRQAMEKFRGAYALVIASPRKLIGVRDPQGFKPLCIGKKDQTYILASETCVLDVLGAEFIRDVEPGEIVTIQAGKEIRSDRISGAQQVRQSRCIFEYIYFARPDSVLDGVGVAASRIQAGRFLARDYPVDADLVAAVPESGNYAALGFSRESGIPFDFVFNKNSYVGRTFIKPAQSERRSSVHSKLNVMKHVVRDKRVVLVDDSLVRGTTSKKIVAMLREAGAKEVHMRISAPPFRHPCYFGIDVPSEEELVAVGRTEEEICALIGADSLGYLSTERLPEMVQGLPICNACFTGDYPV